MKYEEFINSIKESRPNIWFEHSERHHIVPRCLGGTDDEENLIYLTYREHFIAHKLLAEENPDNRGLVYAYWRMCHSYQDTQCTEDEYARAKELVISMMTGKKLPLSTREKMRLSAKNRPPVSEETRKKISSRVISDETRRKISDSHKGKKFSESHKKAISESKKGVWSGDLNPKHINRPIGELNTFYGKQHSEDSRRKISESRRNYTGENHPRYGQTLSTETKNKISKSLQGRTISEETKEKLREACKRKVYHRVCAVCGKEFDARGAAKYCSDECRYKRVKEN